MLGLQAGEKLGIHCEREGHKFHSCRYAIKYTSALAPEVHFYFIPDFSAAALAIQRLRSRMRIALSFSR